VKYIVLQVKTVNDNGEFIRELPFIFPNELVHADVATDLAAAIRSTHIDERRPGAVLTSVVSAGFISSLSIEGGCHGASETLKIASRGKQDDDLIKTLDYMHGII
jgi:hypothetical protein